jgi:DNA-directed RNA polymerase specialized sigma24 family protein
MDDERRERFRALYVSARPRILAYALRRAHNTEDAADVVAETLAIAWKRLEQVPEGDGALLWLYVTARHVLANQSRRARRRSDLVARIDEAALVALAVLRDLGEEDREVLMLSGWEGLDAASVGQVLGCSPAAARIRLHRARRRLEERTADLPGERPAEKRRVVARHKEDEGAAIGRAQEEA